MLCALRINESGPRTKLWTAEQKRWIRRSCGESVTIVTDRHRDEPSKAAGFPIFCRRPAVWLRVGRRCMRQQNASVRPYLVRWPGGRVSSARGEECASRAEQAREGTTIA